MAQTKFPVKLDIPDCAALNLTATFDVHRCRCGRCHNFILALEAIEEETGTRLPSSIIVLPVSVTEFLVTELMGIMAGEGMSQ